MPPPPAAPAARPPAPEPGPPPSPRREGRVVPLAGPGPDRFPAGPGQFPEPDRSPADPGHFPDPDRFPADPAQFPADPGQFPAGLPGPVPRRRVTTWLLAAAAVVIVAAGAAGGWYLTAGRHAARPVASDHTSRAAQPSGAAGSAEATAAEPSTTPSGSPVPSTPVASTPGATAPGTPASAGASPVDVGAGVTGQPSAAAIAGFLGQYFATINDHDYPGWISLFTPAGQQGKTPQNFSTGYAATSDSGEKLVALAPAQQGKTAATVTFVSHQDPSASSIGAACTDWTITLYLRPAGTSYLIGQPPASYHASQEACG